jgi:sec-independent protein translocase protein TatA
LPSSLGPAEIIVILVVALIVLGPKRLPEAGRQVGKALAEVRRWTQDVKYEMSQAFDAETRPDPTAPTTPASPPSPEPEPPSDAPAARQSQSPPAD